MNPLATWKVCILTGFLAITSCFANDFDAVDGPNVRVKKMEDGSRTIFTRSPDNRKLVKKTYTADGKLVILFNYTMDAAGNPLGCKIRDASNTELFKVSYGYHKVTGLLVEELMFDARVRRLNPANGKELPVQRIVYLYDANGKRSAPIAYNLLPGKTYEEVFGQKSSALEVNPFKTGASEDLKR